MLAQEPRYLRLSISPSVDADVKPGCSRDLLLPVAALQKLPGRYSVRRWFWIELSNWFKTEAEGGSFASQG